jgi:hypothetical protein
MPNPDIVAYESEVDRLCASWVADVAKELKHCNDVVKKHSTSLGKKIATVRIPQNAAEGDLKAIPNRINQILKEDSARIKKAVELELDLKIDVKKKKLQSGGWRLSGSVTEMNM